MTDRTRPVVIELDDSADLTPQTAPPVPDDLPPAANTAMGQAVALAARRPSRLARLFWSSLTALIGFAASLAAWNFVTGLLERNPVLGAIALGLTGLVLGALLLIGLRELAALARLSRIDGLHRQAEEARASGDLSAARALVDRLEALYARREDMAWARQRLADRRGDPLDADALLDVAEAELMAPLDVAAQREVENAARQVATVTALVPLALADLVTALTANLRMIRRVAEIYGGRGGMLGNWRLTRAVMAHLVATGAVAVGDDMLEPLIGGGVLGTLSRRFGEGLVNGALTARVGVAAIEVCRPMPFGQSDRPRARTIVKRALTGLFGNRGEGKDQ